MHVAAQLDNDDEEGDWGWRAMNNVRVSSVFCFICNRRRRIDLGEDEDCDIPHIPHHSG